MRLGWDESENGIWWDGNGFMCMGWAGNVFYVFIAVKLLLYGSLGRWTWFLTNNGTKKMNEKGKREEEIVVFDPRLCMHVSEF